MLRYMQKFVQIFSFSELFGYFCLLTHFLPAVMVAALHMFLCWGNHVITVVLNVSWVAEGMICPAISANCSVFQA